MLSVPSALSVEEIIVEIMDELAERAGFQWRNSFAVINDEIGNNTFTDLLEWTTSTYDISLDWWTFDIRRMALGVTFPEGWYDSTIIMVGKESSRKAFEVWAWTEPFSLDTDQEAIPLQVELTTGTLDLFISMKSLRPTQKQIVVTGMLSLANLLREDLEIRLLNQEGRDLEQRSTLESNSLSPVTLAMDPILSNRLCLKVSTS